MSSKAVTFRVRRIPAAIRKTDLVDFLRRSVPGLGDEGNIQLRSLAVSPDDLTFPPSQTATLEFTRPPERFKGATESSWFVQISGSDEGLLFDTNFLGFTPLNRVEDGIHKFDCIAVSGLASHPFGSWRQRTAAPFSPQFNWLRDQLPNDFASLRVLLYGYDTKLMQSNSFQSIDDIARSFIAHLKSIGRAESYAKPLIILAHSLGGILTKRTLVYLAGSGDTEAFMLQKVKLVVFFGVPNRGMHIAHLLQLVREGANQDLVNTLSVHSPYLSMLDEHFSGVATHSAIRIVSAYETVESPVAEQHEITGSFERTGAPRMLVSRESAIQRGSRNPQDIFHIDRDHSNLVKFEPDEIAYFTVRTFVLDILTPGASAVGGDSESQMDPSSPQRSVSGWANQSIETFEQGVADSDAPRPELAYHHRSTAYPYDPIFESLRFPEQHHRVATIEQAQESTFGWIFDRRELHFVEWMLGGHGVYWIRGKPGSGKSTLMRFLHDNDHFRELLQSRRAGERQFDVWFFFNDRGTYLQKSLEGLLRSLLLQLASHNSQLETLISDVFYAQPRESRGQWSMDDINQAFAAVMTQEIIDIEVTVFLDALDEYHGFPEVISKWILDRIITSRSGSSRTTFRFCFSSREWDSFVRSFDHEAGFLLHEQTTQDVRQYVTSRLSDINPVMPSAPNSLRRWPFEFAPSGIVDLISNKAEGVFLWVKLAVDELAFLPTTASMQDLEMQIQNLPRELEAFYERTISRIPKHSRQQAFIFLELVLRSPDLLTLPHILEAEACAHGSTFAECKRLQASFHERTTPSEEAVKHQDGGLLNLCGGLLECVGSGDDSIVQFIHRSVRDFVSSPAFPELILGTRKTLLPENGHTFLLKHRCVSNMYNPDHEVLRLANADETSTGRACSTFVDSLSHSFFDAPTPTKIRDAADVYKSRYTSPFILAVAADLRMYVQRCLQMSNASSLGADVPPINAVAWNVAERGQRRKRHHETTVQTIDLTHMTEILLTHGGSISNESGGLTPFESLFWHCFEGFSGVLWSDITPEMISVAQLLIVKGGQDPSMLLRSTYQNLLDEEGSKLRSALHVAFGEMTEMLLKHGADPNVQDDNGNTSLDVCIGTESNFHELEHGMHRDVLSQVFNNMSVLIKYGGKLTKRGAKVRPIFLKSLEEHHFTSPALDELRCTAVLPVSVSTHDVFGPRSVMESLTASRFSRMKQKAKKLHQRLRSDGSRRP